MRKLSLKNENRGASLLAVLIVLVVVSAIAVVITKVTITNIQMKEVERGTKKNFYSAESVMDALHAGAGEKSADALIRVARIQRAKRKRLERLFTVLPIMIPIL